ncbi:MAG: cellulase family glycosylhydrolase [Lachnospiraceae bacterium]|nr:cellulase family glycosylhydrolase [Lachnospiraceae bacterium]
MKKKLSALALSLLLCLSACGETAAPPTVNPTAVPTAVAAAQTPTEAAVETVTAEAKETPTIAPTEAPTEAAEKETTPTEKPEATKAAEKEETKPAATASTGSPFADHGALHFEGNRMKDSKGANYQLKGVSTHGIGWFPEYVNKDTFRTLKEEWGINCIRLAMYSAEGAGYCTGGDKAKLKSLVENGVKYATDLGLYVIIDWHVLGEQDPNVYKDEAKKFFAEMSKKYASYGNVIYEICNEPNGSTDWAKIKSYAREVIPEIRKNAPDAIIIVGTPTWSQEVDKPAADPLSEYTNIAYTIHFYAATHKSDLRNRMQSALDKGIPLFCSEFGACDASGNGAYDFEEANAWIAAMDKAGVSYCIWNLSNKNESSSLIAAGCGKLSGWKESELSGEGKWYVGVLGGKATGSTKVTESGNGQQGNGQQASPAAVAATSKNTQVSIQRANGWNDGKQDFVQFTLTIKNTGSEPIKDWKLKAEFSSDVKLDQSWNGSYSLSGRTLKIGPADFNNEIAAGSSAEIGFIVCGSGEPAAPSITIE